MADQTAIEWCDSTFNPWIGCTRVSPACDDCYAARSTPARTLAVAWGTGEPRRRTGAANWKQPELWQRQAAEFYAAHGRRRRVFCASLADVFDNEVPPVWRADLFDLIKATPDLDWLLLTKRVGNVTSMVSAGGWPANAWLGITVVNQDEADRDVMRALRVKAALQIPVLFLSCEPLLAPLQLWRLRKPDYDESSEGAEVYPLRGIYAIPDCDWNGPKVDWVIAGGESGPKARPMHPDWARSLRDQCARCGVPFLFKQWGEWTEQDDSGLPGVRTVLEGDPEFESEAAKCDAFMAIDGEVITDLDDGRDGMSYRGLSRPGKKAAGRLLDGRTHDEFPQP